MLDKEAAVIRIILSHGTPPTPTPSETDAVSTPPPMVPQIPLPFLGMLDRGFSLFPTQVLWCLLAVVVVGYCPENALGT